jgi:hypothetical protein
MVNNSIKASDNPQLANNVLNKIQNEQAPVEKAKLQSPADTSVTLPGGYVNAAGEVIKVAEVRELTGKDEELFTKANSVGKMFSIILSSGVVSVGNLPATEQLLDDLLAGDRDTLMLGIYKATFGNTATIGGYCKGCSDFKSIEIDIDEDIKILTLNDPINDRGFTYQGRREYGVMLPNGSIQKELRSNSDRTLAELTTVLLEKTVLSIDGSPSLGKFQIQNIGIVDRKALAEEISKRSPGPVFDDIVVQCPDCDGEVVAPISLGALFRF